MLMSVCTKFTFGEKASAVLIMMVVMGAVCCASSDGLGSEHHQSTTNEDGAEAIKGGTAASVTNEMKHISPFNTYKENYEMK